MEERSDKAVFNFRRSLNAGKRVNCAQAVALSYANLVGLSEIQAMNLTVGFGRGMSKGQTCGAVTAMLMVAGLNDCGQICQELIDSFEQEMGSTLCEDLLKKYSKEHCPHLVKFATQLINHKVFNK